MRFALFYPSFLSDWNNGHAHFARGVAAELVRRGHAVRALEAEDAWSVEQLVAERGVAALDRARRALPELAIERYRRGELDLEAVARSSDVVVVHEWNDLELVARLGALRRRFPFVLLFHDAHHRAATDPGGMERYDLSGYDGALLFGQVIRDLYLERGWVERAWVWHEAADTRHFHPRPGIAPEADLVWIGNWGDDERTAELEELLIAPVRELGLTARVYGVRYPASALAALAAAGIEYRGWLPNLEVPEVFARHRVTVHVPRRPYAAALPGIPTIRVFEALACGIPLVSGPWQDRERLFTPGRDFRVAEDGAAMRRHLAELLADPAARREQAAHGLAAVTARHTCGHRADELLSIAGAAARREAAVTTRGG